MLPVRVAGTIFLSAILEQVLIWSNGTFSVYDCGENIQGKAKN